MTITPDVEPFETSDVLTCSADVGYDPTYTWTGTVNGVAINSHIGSIYTLLEGEFDLTCTATVDELTTCASTAQDTVEGTAVGTDGKYRIELITLAFTCKNIDVNDTVCKLT